MNRNRGEPRMKTYPNDNKRKIRKEEAHSTSLFRHVLFPGRGVLALAAAMLAFCMVAGSARANIAHHSLFLKTNGSLWAMGSNSSGQLGDGTTTQRNSPVQVVSSGVTQVAAGHYHSVFLKSDGSLWAMGSNSSGQLGDGTTTNRNSPVQILASGVTQIAAGKHHSLFLKTDGSLHAMGYNGNGQLGDGTTTNRTSPVQVVSSGVTQIAAGAEHNLFLKSDGSLWVVGRNQLGQLGDGTTTNRTSPVQTVASGVNQIAAGYYCTLYSKTDGSLWTMGQNTLGQLGDGTTTNRHSPVQVVASGVTKIAAGNVHNLFFKTDGSIWAMGYNYYGQLGDGTTTNRNSPVQILASGVTQIAAGNSHSLFLKSDGSLHAMGRNSYGQLGDGTTTQRTSPVQIVASGVARLFENTPTANAAPSITQGTSVSKTMSEDGSPTAWAAPTLDATDGDTANSALVWSVSSAASSGTATVSGTAAAPTTFTYSPNADFNGTDSFVVQVSDGELNDLITVNVTVSGVSDAPVITQGAGPLTVTMSEDGSPTAWSVPTLGATDMETANSTLVWSVSSAASSGTANVSGIAAAPTTFTYAPNADFNGSDSFVVQVSDGASLTDTITVNVTVSGVDDAPVVANAIADLSAAEDAADATIALGNVFNDVDDNNASITKTATSSNASLVTATVSGNVLTLNYQANQSGSATITVTGTSNGQTVSDVFTVTVSATNDAPVVANAIADLRAAEDAADTTIALGNVFNDVDDNNASITKTATSSNASLITATVNGNTLTLDYQANQSGSATITVTGSSNGQTVSDVFTVTVSATNDAPVVANAIADLSAAEDAADTTIALGNVFNDVDDNNASITKTATSSNASLVTATVNGNTLTLDYQENQSGTATITVTGTSNGQTVSDVFTATVTPVDDAPVVANAIADLSAAEDAADATIALGNVFNDVDDDNASITKAVTSSNASLVTATVNGNTLTIDYQASQSGTATITVTGTSNGQTVSDAFTVTVAAVDDAPVVANAIADLSAAEDAADATIDLGNAFNDVDDDNTSITKAVTSSDASLVTATVNGNVLTLDYQANQSGTATITVTGTSNGQAVSDIFDVTVAPVNDAPENLSLSGNEVIENKPAGTIVGSLSATDVDANATLAFSLVDGNGSADNARFTLRRQRQLSRPPTPSTSRPEAPCRFGYGSPTTTTRAQEKAFAISVTNVVEDLDGDAIEDAFDTDDDGDGFSDAEEVAYGSDPMDASSVANQAPSGIALDNSDVIENSPAGTKIGDFLVSDPDDPNDSGAYVVALVAGNGSTDNILFAVGTDGSLRTAAVLDFEANIEHSIRVRVSDEHNASLETVLEISATNSFAPIVRTLPQATDGNGIITFGGAVLTDGGSPVTEVGVLTSDNLRFEGAVSLAATQSANFSVQASSLLPGARYYVRAFATNAEGTTFGAIKRFYTQEAASTPAPWWSDANAVGRRLA